MNLSTAQRIVGWFSCGDASATAMMLTKAALAKRHPQSYEFVIARCIVPEEHEDNDRFARDCEAWFGQPIINLRSTEYESCEDVWTRRRFMSGPHGAVCTLEMKKAVRWEFEREWKPDLQVFGYTATEADRVDQFRARNPEVDFVTPLIDAGLDKEACHAIVDRAGILCSQSYRDGFANANCKGCVQAESPRYWNRTRRLYPAVFEARAALSRRLGVRLVKLTSGTRERIFLDELDPALDDGDEGPAMECGLLCYLAEQTIRATTSAREGGG